MIRPTYRNISSWRRALDPLLTQITCRVRAPSTELAVPALLSYIGSIFGGAPYEAQCIEDTVLIEPFDPCALLTTDAVWTV